MWTCWNVVQVYDDWIDTISLLRSQLQFACPRSFAGNTISQASVAHEWIHLQETCDLHRDLPFWRQNITVIELPSFRLCHRFSIFTHGHSVRFAKSDAALAADDCGKAKSAKYGSITVSRPLYLQAQRALKGWDHSTRNDVCIAFFWVIWYSGTRLQTHGNLNTVRNSWESNGNSAGLRDFVRCEGNGKIGLDEKNSKFINSL